MQRRKVIRNLFFLGIGGGSLVAGVKCMGNKNKPDIAYLEKNVALMAAISDIIIPDTDTPGANEAGVQHFILQYIKDCSPVKDQNKFIDGLKTLQSFCFDTYSKSFIDCSRYEQELIVRKYEKESFIQNTTLQKVRNRLIGKPFFVLFKELTIEGYCTSELGATMGLTYVIIPGSYKGNITMETGQKAWALK